jgi:hypothetical protein
MIANILGALLFGAAEYDLVGGETEDCPLLVGVVIGHDVFSFCASYDSII